MVEFWQELMDSMTLGGALVDVLMCFILFLFSVKLTKFAAAVKDLLEWRRNFVLYKKDLLETVLKRLGQIEGEIGEIEDGQRDTR